MHARYMYQLALKLCTDHKSNMTLSVETSVHLCCDWSHASCTWITRHEVTQMRGYD